jgi:hypothetical protein
MQEVSSGKYIISDAIPSQAKAAYVSKFDFRRAAVMKCDAGLSSHPTNRGVAMSLYIGI